MQAFMIDEEFEFLKKPGTPESRKKAVRIKNNIVNRILTEHREKIIINRCPECDRILETPRSRQCLWCGHKFFHIPRPPRQVYSVVEAEVSEELDDEGSPRLQIGQIRIRHRWHDADGNDAE